MLGSCSHVNAKKWTARCPTNGSIQIYNEYNGPRLISQNFINGMYPPLPLQGMSWNYDNYGTDWKIMKQEYKG